MNEEDKWWSHLKMVDKEKVASWIEGINVRYPFCTSVWNRLSLEQKQEFRMRFKKWKENIEKNKNNE